MSMPPLPAAAIAMPTGYIVKLKEALLELSSGKPSLRFLSGADYFTFTSAMIGEIRQEIRRIESLVATGQIGPKRQNFDTVPWMREKPAVPANSVAPAVAIAVKATVNAK